MGLRNFVRHRYLIPLRGLMHQATYPEEIAKKILFSRDPTRYASLALALERIRRDNIPGALAELGVYRGHTSKFIHLQRPERTLYLFDTFTGFQDVDVEPGTEVDWTKTNIEIVRRALGNSQTVIFCVGHFPETTKGIEYERFALIMIDMDLYKPIKAALEFFYPRMSPGGYIFLHDFNYDRYGLGSMRAAEEFFSGRPEKVVEISDRWGTAIYRKSS